MPEQPDQESEPVHLPPHILRGARAAPPPPPKPKRPSRPGGAEFVVGRRTDNELILFDELERESWIIYPPRSAYAFVAARRPAPEVVIVEQHPWQPYTEPQDHPLDVRAACRLHGAACGAQVAIEAAARLGYNPFS